MKIRPDNVLENFKSSLKKLYLELKIACKMTAKPKTWSEF